MTIIRKALASLCAATLAVSAMSVESFAAEKKQLETTCIYSGEFKIETAWAMGPSVQTTNGSGNFDPTDITEGGYFTVDYTGTEGAVYLAFSEWTSEKWVTVNVPSSTAVNGKGFTSTFSFSDCAAAYGTTDLSDVDAITVGAANSVGDTVITNLSWHGYPTTVDIGETDLLYKGSQTASVKDTNLTFFYTKHVGGEWDAAKINKGSYFYVEYTGEKDGIYLALSSASGATQWVAVYPDETNTTADGRLYSIYKYDNFAERFGTNFARLDEILAYSAKNEEVTLKRIAYFEGTGEPVDTSDGTWDRPETGIAFIGDSIVQNPRVDAAHLNCIDWNGILGRTDCVNYGIGGQTTKECSARIGELAKKNYNKAVMLCGINDIGRGYSNAEIISNYETMFSALIEKNPNIRIYLISVLPTTPVFYTGAQHLIVSLDNDLKALAEKYENVTFVDCYSSFVGDDGYCKEGITFDGLHPNLDGYAIIAGILNPYLDQDNNQNIGEVKNPSIGGSEKSWSDVAAEIRKSDVGEIIIELNGNTTVPAEVIKAIADKDSKVRFIVNSKISWSVDGSAITSPVSADLTFRDTDSLKPTSLRGTEGAQFAINNTIVPIVPELSFDKKYAGMFANLFKSVGGKPEFVDTIKVSEYGKAEFPAVTEKGNYIVMLCGFSDRPGDMNNDGIMSSLDASEVLKATVGIAEGANPIAADVNGDGKVNALDASTILKRIVGIA